MISLDRMAAIESVDAMDGVAVIQAGAVPKSEAERDALWSKGRVTEGWDQGIEGMLVGEIRELKIASELAYGDEGAGDVIPPGATLIYEVELFKISTAEQ